MSTDMPRTQAIAACKHINSLAEAADALLAVCEQFDEHFDDGGMEANEVIALVKASNLSPERVEAVAHEVLAIAERLSAVLGEG